MVDALVSGASVERRAGSSPVLGTQKRLNKVNITKLSRFNFKQLANYWQLLCQQLPFTANYRGQQQNWLKFKKVSDLKLFICPSPIILFIRSFAKT